MFDDQSTLFACRRTAASSGVVITVEGSSYAVRFSYDADVIAKLKTVNPAKKQWDAIGKRWLVAPDAIEIVAGFLQERFGDVTIPQMPTTVPQTVRRIVKLEYLGMCKQRGEAEPTAMGCSEGQWRVVVPQSVLETFFGNAAKQEDGRQTHYQVLCVIEKASPQEIKSAHRRLARSFHPDVNKEDGARERFEQVQAAYELLSDPIQRKKYDCGLYFERQSNQSVSNRSLANYLQGYAPPIRCGILKVEGVIELARLRVSKIVEWNDILDSHGRVLVTTWPAGAKEFQSIWLEADAVGATSPF